MKSQLISLLLSDKNRVEMLQAVKMLDLPEGWIGAGFIRNLVWDYLHGFSPSPLSDVDVIYFDRDKNLSDSSVESQLQRMVPAVNWQARNQAVMHVRNNHEPYSDIEDAISYWPEKETAIAVRLTSFGVIEVIAPFGLESLFAGEISRNPQSSIDLFEERVLGKQWLHRWPKLKQRID